MMLYTRIRSIRYAYISEKLWVSHHGILVHGHCFTLPKLLQRFVHFYVRICSTAQSFRTDHKFNSGIVAQGISITAFGTSALLMLLAEFASCVSLALGGLIATEGQLSLTPCDRSLVGLFWTLFDILSVSYQQDGSGDLDLSSQSGSPFA